MLGGTLHTRLFMKNEPVDDVLIAQIVDILLRGAGVAGPRAVGSQLKREPGRGRRGRA